MLLDHTKDFMRKNEQIEMFDEELSHRVALLEKRLARAQKEIWWIKEICQRTGREVSIGRSAIQKCEQLTMWGT